LKIYLQILFIIGRTYYIQGDIKTATEIYCFIYNMSFSNSLSDLCIKALHRICIIEEKLGMYKSAQKSLEQLLKSKYFVSAKRKAFAHYRMAKCYNGLGNTALAHVENNKSIEIKESLNAQRGLVFSYKLRAQIYMNEDQYDEAIIWAEKSFALAKELSLDKEIIATGLVLARVYLIQKQTDNATDVIKKCIYPAKTYTLVHRLKALKNLCMEYELELMYNSISSAYESAALKLSEEQTDYKRNLEPIVFSRINKNRIDRFFSEGESLSQELLLLL